MLYEYKVSHSLGFNNIRLNEYKAIKFNAQHNTFLNVKHLPTMILNS